MTVVDAAGCAPIKDAAVDLWHCDASGAYSGFESGGGRTGTVFLRGTQVSNSDGVVTFKTIYPGWYPGRATHMHLMVHVGGSAVHTGQLFFEETLNDEVYAASPYDTRTGSRTRNSTDGIFRGAGADKAIVATAKKGSGYAGGIVLGVKV